MTCSKDTSSCRLLGVPCELTLRVLTFLPPRDLAEIAGACRILQVLANEDLLWKELCRHLFTNKKHAPLTLHPLIKWSPPLLSTLTPQECTQILTRRHIKIPAPTTDPTLLTALVRSSTPQIHYKCEWSGKWKATYYVSLLDSKRVEITEGELTEYQWRYIDDWAGTWWGTDHPVEETRVLFKKDKTRAAINGSRPHPRSWHINEFGQVQVAAFATHETERTEDWGWQFGNGYVTYASV